MATIAEFAILNGRIVVHTAHNMFDEWGGFGKISRDEKSFTGNGWNIKIKEPRGKKRGEIVCTLRQSYYGDILDRKQVFPLENGTLLIKLLEPEEGYYIPDYDTFCFLQYVDFRPNSEVLEDVPKNSDGEFEWTEENIEFLRKLTEAYGLSIDI